MQPHNRGMKVVKTKSIPNVSDERLQDSLDQIHAKTHTPEANYNHDGPRRQLIEQGIKGKQISQELIKRGHAKPTCKFWHQMNSRPTPLPAWKQIASGRMREAISAPT